MNFGVFVITVCMIVSPFDSTISLILFLTKFNIFDMCLVLSEALTNRSYMNECIAVYRMSGLPVPKRGIFYCNIFIKL